MENTNNGAMAQDASFFIYKTGNTFGILGPYLNKIDAMFIMIQNKSD
ncbi:hypothetical protein [Gelidibacter pelagius]|uniref:Uncharacterized protein n=1 Tax=Gelidibacter pelagius TaxID=2819985 RepID=A0ABS3SRI5_9FLAO|nr:hypothetical protein [Gelidibacter pelagius]MBO3098325.1 hypothetical protein [Gelidibacter pelagius]